MAARLSWRVALSQIRDRPSSQEADIVKILHLDVERDGEILSQARYQDARADVVGIAHGKW